MNVRLVSATLLTLSLAAFLPAAEEAANTTTSQATKDAIRARIREDMKKQAANPKPAPAPATPTNPVAPPASASASTPTTATTPAPAPEPISATPRPLLKSVPPTPEELANAPTAAPATAATKKKDKAATAAAAATPAAKAASDPATVLPKVEVNRTRPTELGRQLYEQEKEIAREKQLTKSSELDKALNDPKFTLPIFGGQSTDSRKSIAAERVSLMEAEKDLIEEIARAKTKEEKATLQKELAELKKIRRELEHSIR